MNSDICLNKQTKTPQSKILKKNSCTNINNNQVMNVTLKQFLKNDSEN